MVHEKVKSKQSHTLTNVISFLVKLGRTRSESPYNVIMAAHCDCRFWSNEVRLKVLGKQIKLCLDGVSERLSVYIFRSVQKVKNNYLPLLSLLNTRTSEQL